MLSIPPPSAPLHLRAWFWMRSRTCPFQRLVRFLPERGTLVDFGCGYGAFVRHVLSSRPQLRVLAIDAERSRVETAARWFSGTNVEWRVANALPAVQADAIALVDVLYLLAPHDQRRLLAACAEALAPRGVLLIKTMARHPRWKALWNDLQDLISVRLLGLHGAVQPRRVSLRALREMLDELGMRVELFDVGRGYPHPHVLLRARRAC